MKYRDFEIVTGLESRVGFLRGWFAECSCGDYFNTHTCDTEEEAIESIKQQIDEFYNEVKEFPNHDYDELVSTITRYKSTDEFSTVISRNILKVLIGNSFLTKKR